MKIETKFDIGQECYCVYRYWYDGMNSELYGKLLDIIKVKISEIHIHQDETIDYIFEPAEEIDWAHSHFHFSYNKFEKIPRIDRSRYILDYKLFATREEAEAKLKELQNDN